MIRFSTIISTCCILACCTVSAVDAQPADPARIEGLLVGALLGDAAGGPDEFQKPEQSIWTQTDTVLSAAGIQSLADRFKLKPYTRRPNPESYGQWRANAPAGTVTDDSRFKIIFFQSLEAAGKPSRRHFAEALLNWYADSTSVYGTLPQLWLAEFAYAARWELGERDPERARPPERQWGGIPTMAGQMPFLPIAALVPGQPGLAYTLTWEMDFMDNGVARDMNAALVAGLAAALAPDATWMTVEAAMRETDPYGFGEIDWVPRRLDRWLDVAEDVARRAEGRPHQLFRLLEQELNAETWWEAWVPMTVVFACARMTDYNPLATLQLIMEFGYDTDSYMQVAGALFGALHGAEVFPAAMRTLIARRLQEDYQVSPAAWMDLIERLQ
ncbi:MAG: ADP-ribosylglycohydrolase family protein [Bacteroidota bacterium]